MRRSLAGRYCDLDMVVGNLPLFVSRAELEQHDIVTYSFGDQEALYLRGQWTVHRNEPRVSSVWQRCDHIAGQLQKELLLKVAWVRRMESRGIANYPKRFQSAEGCYSHQAREEPRGAERSREEPRGATRTRHVSPAPGRGRRLFTARDVRRRLLTASSCQQAVSRGDLRIAMVHKQAVGLTASGEPEAAIYAVDGAVWRCAAETRVDPDELARRSSACGGQRVGPSLRGIGGCPARRVTPPRAAASSLCRGRICRSASGDLSGWTPKGAVGGTHDWLPRSPA